MSNPLITQQDIANHLGISRASVNKALSGSSIVSARTIEKVRLACKELGYMGAPFVLNEAALQLTAVGLLVPMSFIDSPQVIRLVNAIYHDANRYLYTPILFPVQGATQIDSAIRKLIILKARGIFSFVSLERVNKIIIKQFHDKNQPIITFDTPNNHTVETPYAADYISAGQRAASYLLKQGHRTISVLHDESLAAKSDVISGISLAIESYPSANMLIQTTKYSTINRAQSLAAMIKKQDRLPDAWVCASPELACGIQLFENQQRRAKKKTVISLHANSVSQQLKIPAMVLPYDQISQHLMDELYFSATKETYCPTPKLFPFTLQTFR